MAGIPWAPGNQGAHARGFVTSVIVGPGIVDFTVSNQYGDRVPIPSRRLVFIHVPKCGGTSIVYSLQQQIGAQRILKLYKDADRVQIPDGAGKLFLVGHFLPMNIPEKWQKAFRFTVLREPVDRLTSHWLLWRYAPPSALGRVLRKQVSSGTIGLLDFAQIPRYRYLFTQVYFHGVDMGSLNLIILQSNYAAGVRKLSEKIRLPLEAAAKNVSARYVDNFADRKREILEDAGTMKELRLLLSEDIEFYEQCKRLPSAVL